ncbi:MAG: hypothetical protein JNM40_04475 [Myxococcales bacterium]|nr:hypothetical protein [Myxococcales bacterium]
MPLYRCEWPNGDVSFVLADNIEDAIVKLDEWGEATPQMIRRVQQFLIDLSPRRAVLRKRAARLRSGLPDDLGEQTWKLGELGECMIPGEPGGLPSEDLTWQRIRSFAAQRKRQDTQQQQQQDAEQDGTLDSLTARRLRKLQESLASLLGRNP